MGLVDINAVLRIDVCVFHTGRNGWSVCEFVSHNGGQSWVVSFVPYNNNNTNNNRNTYINIISSNNNNNSNISNNKSRSNCSNNNFNNNNNSINNNINNNNNYNKNINNNNNDNNNDSNSNNNNKNVNLEQNSQIKFSLCRRFGRRTIFLCSNNKIKKSEQNNEKLGTLHHDSLGKIIQIWVLIVYFISCKLWCLNGYHSLYVVLPSAMVQVCVCVCVFVCECVSVWMCREQTLCICL